MIETEREIVLTRLNLKKFWANIDRRGPDECWHWKRGVHHGYGHTAFKKKRIMAHRATYHLLIGPIPEGTELDHVCHNRDADCVGGDDCPHRSCVNPWHLEPVDHSENVKRGRTGAHNAVKTHCPKGHPYSGENLYEHVRNGLIERKCRACAAETRRRYWDRKAS